MGGCKAPARAAPCEMLEVCACVCVSLCVCVCVVLGGREVLGTRHTLMVTEGTQMRYSGLGVRSRDQTYTGRYSLSEKAKRKCDLSREIGKGDLYVARVS